MVGKIRLGWLLTIAIVLIAMLTVTMPALAGMLDGTGIGDILMAEADDDDDGGADAGDDGTGDEGDDDDDDDDDGPQEPTPYLIVFDPNLGEATGSMSSMLCMTGTEYSLTPNAYAATHYTFSGWNTEEDGSGTSYADGQAVTDPAADEDEVTLYAQWTPRTYKIMFEGNGGTGSMDPVTHAWDEEFNLPQNTFQRPGYGFRGWCSSQTGDAMVLSDSQGDEFLVSNIIDEDVEEGEQNPFDEHEVPEITLYALWYSNTYTVHFNRGHSSATGTDPESQTLAYDEPIILPENPYDRDGYLFVGWGGSATGQRTPPLPAGSSVGGLITDDATETTLYAQWRKPAYTITYDKGDANATGMPAFESDEDNSSRRADWTESNPSTWVETFQWDDEFKLPVSGLSLSHFTFDGWKFDPDEILTLDSSDGTAYKNLSNDDTGATTLYAAWLPYEYEIVYDDNVPSDAARTDNFTENDEWQTMTQSLSHGTATELADNPYATNYYQFAGWNSKADGSGTTYADGQVVQPVSAGETPQAGAMAIDATAFANGTKITLYAQWTPRDLTVTTMDGITNETIATQSVTRGSSWQEPQVPAHPGYVANPREQWSVIGSTGDSVDSSALSSVTQDLIVVITYSPISFTISFDGNQANTSGEVIGTMEPMTVQYGGDASLPDCEFTNVPNEFLYWSTSPTSSDPGTKFFDGADESDDGEVKVNALSTEDGGHVTLYAQWSKEEFSIAFIDGFSTSPIEGEDGDPLIVSAEYGTPISSLLPSFDSLRPVNKHDGYLPDKWVTATGEDIPEGATATVNTSFVLQYRPVSYTVKFDGNASDASADPAMPDKVVTYDTEETLPECTFTRPGHNFAGWNTSIDGSGEIYEDGAPMRAMCTEDGGQVTLYAQWTAGSLSVTFYDGLTNTKITDVTIAYGNDVEAPEAPKHTGYKPTGWDHSLTSITTDNLVITMDYSPISYKIAFDANADSESPATGQMGDQAMTYDQAATLSACLFIREGYTFSHWTTSKDDTGSHYNDRQTVNNLTDEDNATVTLYAQWKEALNVTYTVRHTKAGASSPFAEDRLIGRIGETTKATPRQVLGYLPGEFSQRTIDSESTFVIEIPYEPIAYTIVFDANSKSATGKVESVATSYDATVTLPENKFALYGHTWMSWNTSPSGTGYSFSDAQSVRNLASKQGDKVTLYAQWSKLYIVTYIDPLEDAASQIVSRQPLTDAAKAVDPTPPSHTGYKFTGWSKNVSLSGDVTYTAVYEETDLNGRTTPESNSEEVDKSVTDRKTIVKRTIKNIVKTTVKWTKGTPGGSAVTTTSGANGGTAAGTNGTGTNGGTGTGTNGGTGTGTGTGTGSKRSNGSVSSDTIAQMGDASVWICGASIATSVFLLVTSMLRNRKNEA